MTTICTPPTRRPVHQVLKTASAIEDAPFRAYREYIVDEKFHWPVDWRLMLNTGLRIPIISLMRSFMLTAVDPKSRKPCFWRTTITTRRPKAKKRRSMTCRRQDSSGSIPEVRPSFLCPRRQRTTKKLSWRTTATPVLSRTSSMCSQSSMIPTTPRASPLPPHRLSVVQAMVLKSKTATRSRMDIARIPHLPRQSPFNPTLRASGRGRHRKLPRRKIWATGDDGTVHEALPDGRCPS